MSFKSLAVILTALTATSAMADGHASTELHNSTDLYGFGFLGTTQLQDPTFSGTVGGARQTVDTFFDNSGTNIGIGIGRALPSLGSGIRGEVELSYSNSDIDNTNFSGNGPARENANGDVSTTRILASLYKDFDTGTVFTPYVGAGLGVSVTDVDITYGPGVSLNDVDQNLSAQIVLGGAYSLTDQLAITSDVRLTRDFGVSSRRFDPAGALTGTVSDDIDTASFNLGIRFAF